MPECTNMDTKQVTVVDPESQESTVISMAVLETTPAGKGKQRARCGCCGPVIGFLDLEEKRRLVHGAKVGLALVLVSLLYMLEVVHDRLGDNAMWAVMTVVVVFEFTAGATISKGVNRGAGTILGGGLGTVVALMAQEIGGDGKALVIGTFVFIFGTAATFCRMIPKIKKKYEYGAIIFILTFNLIAVSGVRVNEIVTIASDRLFSITIGFVICVFINLFIFPTWAGDELHTSLVSKFDILGHSIEECFEDYKSFEDEKTEAQTICSPSKCSSVLSSKSSDETLANFAKWEPWHGRFGFYYPWNKYLKIGELLRELTSSILSLKGCLDSKLKPSLQCSMLCAKERYEPAFALIGCTLRELGDNICNMKQCNKKEITLENFEMMRTEICSRVPASTPLFTVNQNETMNREVSITSILFLLLSIMDKMEELVKEVEELGKTAGFAQPQLN